MPRLMINPAAPADRQVEVHAENSGALLAAGFLSCDVMPREAGDRLGSLQFITTYVAGPPSPADDVQTLGRLS
jgi:hypothetical protein